MNTTTANVFFNVFVKRINDVKTSLAKITTLPKNVLPDTILDACDDDLLILIDALYYAGRSVNEGSIQLPSDPKAAADDIIKICVDNMDNDGLSFGSPKNDKVLVREKSADAILKNVNKSISVIEAAL